jgi:hypothetical protein
MCNLTRNQKFGTNPNNAAAREAARKAKAAAEEAARAALFAAQNRGPARPLVLDISNGCVRTLVVSRKAKPVPKQEQEQEEEAEEEQEETEQEPEPKQAPPTMSLPAGRTIGASPRAITAFAEIPETPEDREFLASVTTMLRTWSVDDIYEKYSGRWLVHKPNTDVHLLKICQKTGKFGIVVLAMIPKKRSDRAVVVFAFRRKHRQGAFYKVTAADMAKLEGANDEFGRLSSLCV